ncbi:unnamed protein product [Caenorhabditis bovis]|uniref:BHLH domain-containing protein n=1 Tax=Caenorhabditis bovis TaxID=2654633 RepID=A0A8S1EJJ0_9PELO|nr:unnamed protein product [Caenorhabditis bovis]
MSYQGVVYQIDRRANIEQPRKKREDKKRMPGVVAKRNARERTRVHTAFLVLKQHLPTLRQFTKRVSKLRILNAAIHYIDALNALLQSNEMQPIIPKPITLTPTAPAAVKLQLPPSSIEVLAKPSTFSADTSLVDYKSAFDAPIPTVFTTPDPTSPHYMKSLLADYQPYLYQLPTSTLPAPVPSTLLTSNQLLQMPTYHNLC